MSSKSKGGARRYGNPAKRTPLHGDLARLAQPTGIANPRKLGGQIIDVAGDSRAQAGAVLDLTDVVLLEEIDVATVDTLRMGETSGQAIFATLGGRINKKSDRVAVGFLMPPDGAAGLITELLALSDRFGAELLDDVTRRLTELHQGKHVDLHFLRAAIDNAIEASEAVTLTGE
jgi:hypothetical protein